ncbi:MAG: tetratricopeptide repeat protein [bacterium]|jgi:tetratricopeptide (TPR) repeat protein|nr:tetratricopeptide repeat protein [candidate division KSB1 bacterium]MDH7561184.1 tetratricopeptide repeat protein [bacterium]
MTALRAWTLVLLLGLCCGQAMAQLPDSLRLAYDYEAIGQYDRAAQVFGALYAKNPQNIAAYQGLRRNLLRMGRLDELAVVIKRRLALGDLQAQVDWAELLYRRGQEREALGEWHRILKEHPRNLNVYEMVAASLSENRLLDEAIAVYRQAREETGRPTLFALQMADLYASRLNFREATRENLLFLRENPQQWSVVQARVGSYATSAQGAAEVAEVLTQELSSSTHQLPLRRILASLWLRTRQWARAFENFVEADRLAADAERNRGTVGTELFGFAETARQEGAYEFAEKAYALLLARYPGSPLALRAEFQRAVLLKEMGQYQAAIDGFTAVADHYRRSREACAALLEAASVYFNFLRDAARCQQVLGRLMGECPSGSEQGRALLLLGDCKLAAGDVAGAREAYRQAARSKDAAREEIAHTALFRIGELAFLTGQLDSAATILSRVASASGPLPERVTNDALELLLLLKENADDNDALRAFAEALLWRRQWQPDQALRRLEQLVRMQPPPAIADEAWMEIASIQTEQGGYQEAIQAYDQVYKGFLESRFRDLALKGKAELLEAQLANDAGAAKAYEEFLATFPTSVYVEEVRKRLRAVDARMEANKRKGER